MQHPQKQEPVVGIIPARFGSTRFPGKPLVEIEGKTLIQRTYENAKRCQALDDLVVATDDVRIFEHVQTFGGKAVMTASHHLNGTERLAEAIRENDFLAPYNIILNIQGDEPCIEPHILEQVAGLLQQDPSAALSTAAVKIRAAEEAHDFSVIKCVMDQQGYALYFSRTLIPSGHDGHWKPHVTYYRHLGIYGYRRDFLLHYASLNSTPLQMVEDLEQLKVLENGYRVRVAVVESASIGIDKPEDIHKIRSFL